MSSPNGVRRRGPQRRGIETRARILDAAGQVFLEKGYSGTGVADLIFAADVSKGAFYGHFKGKLDVAKAIMDNTLSMDGLVPQRIKLQEVVDIGLILAHRVTESALLAALTLSFHHDAREIYGTPWPNWIEFNTAQLTEAQVRGEVRPHVDPRDFAYQIAGAWAGIVFTGRAIDGDLRNVAERISFSYRSLMAVIAQPEVLPYMDFSEGRGERLFLKTVDAKASSTSAST
ncbi:TetR family transcriptional regulator [Streptomyces sp. NPDC006285]|uniref:TetR family transcriptional regulator n=1 Tax=Streptomyces sp. NPDC006285 TaxID=3364742 RepID=UPI00369FE96B